MEARTEPRVIEGGIEFAVAVRPGSRIVKVGGTRRGDLAVAVRAVPERGRANLAVEEAIADAFGRPRRDVSLISGHKGRQKRIRIHGESVVLRRRWGELVAGDD